MSRPIALFVMFALVVSCSGEDKSIDSAATAPTTALSVGSTVAAATAPPTTDVPIATLPADQVAQLVAERPYNIFVPSSYDATTAMPLVLVLHGFGSNATDVEGYLEFQQHAEERGFIYARPGGTTNERGEQFWNATDACCGGTSTVDDSTYLRAVVDDLKAKLNVDPNRVYIAGYSNGGFMAYRMACEHAEAIAAIVSVAGATFLNADRCAPTEPVSVLQVHGTADRVIYLDGGTFMQPFPYPSALQTVETWSAYNECSADEPAPFDLDPDFAGDEALIIPFTSCASDTAVELWIIDGVGHAPIPSTRMGTLIDFLFAHPKA